MSWKVGRLPAALVTALFLCSIGVSSAPAATDSQIQNQPVGQPGQQRGVASYTIEQVSPSTQSTPVLFEAPYYYFTLTNTGGASDDYKLVMEFLDAPVDWFAQVCIGAICFPDSTVTTLGAGESASVGVNPVPFSDGVGTFSFYVESVSDPGLNDIFAPLTLYAGDSATAVSEFGDAEANGVSLRQAHPNPVRETTQIAFALSEATSVSLRIYDVSGRAVRTLAEGTHSAGAHTVSWDGNNDLGTALAGGVYFYRLSTATGTLSKRLILIR